MDGSAHANPAPRPRPFPVHGVNPGPRCGHTLTAIAIQGKDEKINYKLVMFGRLYPRSSWSLVTAYRAGHLDGLIWFLTCRWGNRPGGLHSPGRQCNGNGTRYLGIFIYGYLLITVRLFCWRVLHFTLCSVTKLRRIAAYAFEWDHYRLGERQTPPVEPHFQYLVWLLFL